MSVISCAAQQTCSTPSDSAVADGLVSASASFSFGDGFVTIGLTNTQANSRSAGQLLNGIVFTFDGGQNAGTLGPNSANIRKVLRGGKFVDFGPSGTGWALGNDPSGNLELCVLCTDLGAVGPKNLLIGPPAASGGYVLANPSVAGNGPHNPFTSGTATFLVYVPGITSDSIVTSVIFSFGTAAGVAVPSDCGGIPPD